MKRTIVIACMLLLLAPMPALAADLVIDAPETVLVGESFVVTVTAEGSPVRRGYCDMLTWRIAIPAHNKRNRDDNIHANNDGRASHNRDKVTRTHGW